MVHPQSWSRIFYSYCCLPLTCCFLFFLLSFCHVLLPHKSTKRPGTGRSSRFLLLLVNCRRQYNSSVVSLPFQAFLPFAGRCGTRFVRLCNVNYTRTSLIQSSRNGLHTAGLCTLSLTVPVYFENYFCCRLFHCTSNFRTIPSPLKTE